MGCLHRLHRCGSRRRLLSFSHDCTSTYLIARRCHHMLAAVGCLPSPTSMRDSQYWLSFPHDVTIHTSHFAPQVIHSPEMIEVAQDVPIIRTFLQSLYDCNYAEFFRALGMQGRPQSSPQLAPSQDVVCSPQSQPRQRASATLPCPYEADSSS